VIVECVIARIIPRTIDMKARSKGGLLERKKGQKSEAKGECLRYDDFHV
jgi:hypothetical protein